MRLRNGTRRYLKYWRSRRACTNICGVKAVRKKYECPSSTKQRYRRKKTGLYGSDLYRVSQNVKEILIEIKLISMNLFNERITHFIQAKFIYSTKEEKMHSH